MPGHHQTYVIPYEGHNISYRDDGWFNATEASAKFDKTPAEWLRLPSTTQYLDALKRKYGNFPYSTAKRGSGGGTWFHPKLAVAFARWLDPDFAVWCDEQIDRLIRSKDNWSKARHLSAAGAKLQCAMLQEVRRADGKDTLSHHYANEHKLLNSLLTGKFEGLDRDAMSVEDLDFLGHFEIRNSMMLAKGMDYQQRKSALLVESTHWRRQRGLPYNAANDEDGELAA